MAAGRVTQFQLATQLGVSQGTVSKYLAGKRRPHDVFWPRALDAIERLGRAERAANEARRKALAS